MALRNKIFLACESLLRVPPLLVIDEIFRYNFGLSDKWTPEGGILSEDTGATGATDVISRRTDPGIGSEFASLSSSFFGSLWSLIGGASMKAIHNASHSSSGDSSGIADPSHYMNLDFGDWNVADSPVGEFLKLLKVFVLLQLCAAALVVFVLSTKNLVKLYSFVLAFSSIYISYYFTPLPLTGLNWAVVPALLLNIIVNIVIRAVLAGTYFLTRSWPGGYPEFPKTSFGAAIFNVLDVLMFSLFFVTGVVRFQGFIYLLLVLLLQASLWTALPKLYHFLNVSWEDTKRIRNEFGISHLIQRETGRLRINAVFRLFWISRALYDVFYQLPDQSIPNVLRLVLTNGSETLLGIIGLTVTVSAVAHQIGAFLLWILYHGTNSETDINRFGSISTVLFFILCLQTSLTSLDPDKRLDRLFKNVVLLSTALLHALHQMVAPLLHAFRSFQALQTRAVVLSVIFLFVSLWSSIFILQTSVVSTWSVAVLALALEFKIKIIVTLLISLFVYFSQRIETPEMLQRVGQALREVLPQGFFARFTDHLDNDDIIFYLKSFSHSAEFITGIFLFVNAIWIFLFESASAIRALGMGIHAYFNIWCEGRKGWRIYCQRRTASKKIDSLTDANEQQLAHRRDDVCAICYEEMESAKVTLCGHLFHSVCLRKWLYVQNTCPLCHEILYAEEVVDQTQEHDDEDNEERNVDLVLQAQAREAQAQVPRLDNNSNQFLPIRYEPVPEEPGHSDMDHSSVDILTVGSDEDSDFESDWSEVDQLIGTSETFPSTSTGAGSSVGTSSPHQRYSQNPYSTIPQNRRHRILLTATAIVSQSSDEEYESDFRS